MLRINEGTSLLQFPIDNIFVEVGEHNFQQIIDIPMGTKYTPLHFNLLLYAYILRGTLSTETYQIQTIELKTLKPFISHAGVLMLFCQLRIQTLLIGFHQYFQNNLR